MKKTKKKNNYIIKTLLIITISYIIGIITPLDIKNFIYLKYKQKEINREYKEIKKEEKFNTTNNKREQYKIYKKPLYDLYGNNILILQEGKDPISLISKGKDENYNTNDDIILKENNKDNKDKFLNQFNWNIAWHIEDFNNQFYSVMYKYWQKNPFITATIPWGIPGLKDITLTLSVENYGKTELKNCEKNRNNNIMIFVNFDIEKLYEIKSTQTIQCTLEMKYNYNGINVSTKSYYSLVAHPLNDFSWDNPEMISCYVMPDDIVISSFSDTFINIYKDDILEYKFKKAGVLYYALKNYYDIYNSAQIQPNYLFPSEVLINKDTTPYKISLLLSSIYWSQGVENFLAVIKSNKEIYILVPVENFKEKEDLITIDKSINVLGIIKVNLPKKVIKSSGENIIKRIIMKEKGEKFISLDVSQIIKNEKNSFIESLRNGKKKYERCLDENKLQIIDIKSAAKKGYVYPEIKQRNFSLPNIEIKKEYQKEINNILKIDLE